METTQDTIITPEAPTKKVRRRIPKLSAADIAKFPGATPPPEKKVEPDFSYFIKYSIPATANLGTLTEAGQVHDFAYQFDAQAKVKGVGAVSSVGVMNGIFDIVLKLNSTGEETDHGAPAANAFTLLNDFLGNAALLKKGPAGKPASYRALVNGTTIVEGHF